MGKCLVTKLNGTVNNNDLLHIGECVIGIESSSADELLFQVNTNNTEYYCEQDHKLGEENVSGGVKKTIIGWKDLKSISAGLYRFHFFDKYNISAILEKSQLGVYEINGLSFLNKLSEFSLMAKDLFDLDNLKQSKLLKLINISGNITGDISSLKEMSNVTNLIIKSSKVTGDINSIKRMSNLNNLSGTLQINCYAQDIQQFTNLQFFSCENTVTKSNFGDIALLPKNFTYLFIGENASISWTSRPSTSKIIGIFGSPKLSNIDKMLQDQAQCVTGITSSSADYTKVISATGTRTSASDAAVSTLQQKGYTVSITHA